MFSLSCPRLPFGSPRGPTCALRWSTIGNEAAEEGISEDEERCAHQKWNAPARQRHKDGAQDCARPTDRTDAVPTPPRPTVCAALSPHRPPSVGDNRVMPARRARIGWAALLTIVGLPMAGCTTTGHHPTISDARSSTALNKPTGCIASTIHNGVSATPTPGDGVSGTAFSLQSSGVPWMGNDRFIAVLFYAKNGDPTMRAGGTMPNGGTTKILWWAAQASDGPLVIHGTAAEGAAFTQTVPGLGNGQYPSIVDVPAKGCWTLRTTVRGREVGAITVPVDPPAAVGQ